MTGKRSTADISRLAVRVGLGSPPAVHKGIDAGHCHASALFFSQREIPNAICDQPMSVRYSNGHAKAKPFSISIPRLEIECIEASVDKVSSRSHSLSGVVGPYLECCNGPSIEGHYDEAPSVLGLVDQILDGSAADAHVIGYFGDRGLHAARKCVRPCRASAGQRPTLTVSTNPFYLMLDRHWRCRAYRRASLPTLWATAHCARHKVPP
jgi:hypothetical protein